MKQKCIICKAQLKKDTNFGIVGGDVKISFGYPSNLDGMDFSGNMCSICADELYEKKLLKLTHNEFK